MHSAMQVLDGSTTSLARGSRPSRRGPAGRSRSLTTPYGWGIQPDRILADGIGGDKSQGRPGTGEVRLAATKHKWAEVETILVDETEIGEAPREFGPGDVDFALDFHLQPAH